MPNSDASRAIAIVSLFVGCLLILPNPGDAQFEKDERNVARPIAGIDTIFLEEMTWMEVRDALVKGKTTAIVATGGVEQNGPYLATGKHNVILKATTESIARKLGNALVAPIVPFVPEGDIDPPSGHMKYPGTISVTEETYERLIIDIVSSLKTHGFTDIVLIGDSGGNQDGLEAVAKDLNNKWAKTPNRVHFIAEYYDYESVDLWLKKQGIQQITEGIHDDFAITAQMALVDPVTIRAEQRIAVGKFRINGVDLAPLAKTVEWGKKIVEFRSEATVKAIKASFETSRRTKPE